jgi:hypothetical protein
MRARSPTGRELAAAALLLLGLGGAVWGSHVVDGGFYWADDWYHAALHVFPPRTGLFANRNAHTTSFRPVLGILLSLPYDVFGLRTELHLALAIVLSVGASLAFYWLLRTVGLERVASWVIAALALLFPWSDSSRLWTTGSLNNVALILYFVGTVLSLRGLRAAGARSVRLALAGATLYTLAVLTYEVVAGAVLLSLAPYTWWAGLRRAWRRWALDLAFVLPALVYVWARQPAHHTDRPGAATQVRHAFDLARGAVELLWSAVAPGAIPHAVTAAAVLALVAVSIAAWRSARPDDPSAGELGRGLLISAAAAGGVLVSYAPFVPGRSTYLPSAGGVQNRVNLLAGFGFAVLVYALAMLLATLTGRLAHPRKSAHPAVAVVVCLAVAAGYVVRDQRDKADFAHATRLANHELETIARLVPRPAPGTVIYAFGAPNYVAPGVPVFALAGDLRWAIKVQLRNRLVSAYPVRPPTRWACERERLYPHDYSFGAAEGTVYGRAVFVSIPRAQAVRIESEADCRKWSRRFGHPPVDELPR